MPETPDLPVDLSQPFVTFGPVGAVVIGSFALYGATCATIDVTRSVKAMLKARKLNKELKAEANTTK